MTITEFLLSRIAEDEADALPFRNELGDVKEWRCDEIGGAVREVGTPAFGLPDLLAKFDTHLEGAHVARWDPTRVLAECAAKRAIIGSLDLTMCPCSRSERCVFHDSSAGPISFARERYFSVATEVALKSLAAIYADHPDYDPVLGLVH